MQSITTVPLKKSSDIDSSVEIREPLEASFSVVNSPLQVNDPSTLVNDKEVEIIDTRPRKRTRLPN